MRARQFMPGAIIAACMLVATAATPTRQPPGAAVSQMRAVQRAVDAFVAQPGGPPGAIVVVQRDASRRVFRAGVADITRHSPIGLLDHMRVASVAKAYSGATALALVADGALHLDDTVGQWRPDLSHEWSTITVRQLLGHTSGIPDFSNEQAFFDAFVASLEVAPPPEQLLSYIANPTLLFTPGTQYAYSNSDNVVIGLIVERVTDTPYASALAREVTRPLGLPGTTLPDGPLLPRPFAHGYDVRDPAQPEDVSQLFAAGWSYASGGVVATPLDLTRFVRAYVAGEATDPATRREQFQFVPGGTSEPPGPGTNSAGLALFRYDTRCGTVYGHTGNTAGYTQFVSATADGRRSATVSITAQITPKSDPAGFAELRALYESAVCAALA